MTGARRMHAPRSGVRRRSGLVLHSVRPVAERVASELGLAVWDVDFRREAGRETLRVAVDREGGIDAESLTLFSESFSRELDMMDAVLGDGRYLLEVTSPGAERRLRTPEHFALCRGRPVRITFKDGREPVEGTLDDVSPEGIRVGSLNATFQEISQARLNVPGA